MYESINELRSTRIDKGISLEDIASATRINIKFLEAIEKENFSILPPVYIKAFISSYAEQVGLNSEKILNKFEQEYSSGVITNQTCKPISPHKVRLGKQKGLSQSAVLVIVVTLIIVGFTFSIIFFSKNSNKQFAVTTKHEFVTQTDTIMSIDTVAVTKSTSIIENSTLTRATIEDSLILTIIANESAWIRVIIDNKIKKEILLPPHKSVQWKAKDQYCLNLGNAGGTSIKLNDIPLAPFGLRGTVVKDLVLNWNTFDSLKSLNVNR